MRVLVTGGAGNIGFKTVVHLLDHGFQVRVLDRENPDDFRSEVSTALEGSDYRQGDILDYDGIAVHFDSIDAVVHLAAIPHPIFGKDDHVFQLNTSGAFNVYQASAACGIKKVVSASSINFLGNGFGKRVIPVSYFPIDEAHPGYSTDAYAFSKQILENIAGYFQRSYGIDSLCLRFPFVLTDWFIQNRGFEMVRQGAAALEAIRSLPEEDQAAHAQSLIQVYKALWKKYFQGELALEQMISRLENYPGSWLLFGLLDFWAYLDVQDAAEAIRAALLAPVSGCHPLYIAALDNMPGLPPEDLAKLFYPEVITRKRELVAVESLIDSSAAEELIGFSAQHTLRSKYDG